VNLYLSDTLIAKTTYHFRDEYNDPRLRKSSFIKLEEGKKYKIKVEAGDSYGDARVQLVWSKPQVNRKEELKHQAIEVAKQSDVVIMCMGLTARLEGEEMDIKIDGFNGGDRTTLDLPKVQEELIREIHSLGKPVVLVLLNGSALSINWESQNIPAILETWYPGQAAGQAIADVIFGDYSPAGRLPVTFYKSISDLPPFEDYDMKGRTYRYFKGDVLYPFGYGLSYTNFAYDDLKVAPNLKTSDSVKVSVNVRNTGKMEGDEVVQLYLSNLSSTVPVPIRSLGGFKRIHLLRGEAKTVNLVIAPNAFSIIDNNNKRVIQPGKFEIAVGCGQPGTISERQGKMLRAIIDYR
jgi:beta-glucosidase